MPKNVASVVLKPSISFLSHFLPMFYVDVAISMCWVMAGVAFTLPSTRC